jgi:cell division protein FtsQ
MLENVKQMQRLSFLIMIVVVLLFFIIAVIYILKYTLQIKHININGDFNRINSEQVVNIVKNDISGNFLTMNLLRLKHDIKSINWVKNVDIERIFPDTINIKIDEHIPYAMLNNEHTILTQDEEIINNSDLLDIPFFSAPVDKIDSVINLYNLGNNFAKEKNLKIVNVIYDGFNVIIYKFSNKLRLTMCNNNLEEDFIKLNKYWQNILDIESSLTSINMCYKNAIAISHN